MRKEVVQGREGDWMEREVRGGRKEWERMVDFRRDLGVEWEMAEKEEGIGVSQ